MARGGFALAPVVAPVAKGSPGTTSAGGGAAGAVSEPNSASSSSVGGGGNDAESKGGEASSLSLVHTMFVPIRHAATTDRRAAASESTASSDAASDKTEDLLKIGDGGSDGDGNEGRERRRSSHGQSTTNALASAAGRSAGARVGAVDCRCGRIVRSLLVHHRFHAGAAPQLVYVVVVVGAAAAAATANRRALVHLRATHVPNGASAPVRLADQCRRLSAPVQVMRLFDGRNLESSEMAAVVTKGSSSSSSSSVVDETAVADGALSLAGMTPNQR